MDAGLVRFTREAFAGTTLGAESEPTESRRALGGDGLNKPAKRCLKDEGWMLSVAGVVMVDGIVGVRGRLHRRVHASMASLYTNHLPWSFTASLIIAASAIRRTLLVITPLLPADPPEYQASLPGLCHATRDQASSAGLRQRGYEMTLFALTRIRRRDPGARGLPWRLRDG